ncbi:hypothetical protein [Morganella morganii]|uniref:hypothetical protein n=1 Tax=Morganella morganii TaxID=582 RepID=UPI003EB819DF
MKERGIIFNAEMVCAILDGRKTQTRRLAEFKVIEEGYNLNFSGLKSGFYCYGVPSSGFVLRSMGAGCWNDRTFPLYCPFGNVGDRIWVRETFGLRVVRDAAGGTGEFITYRASKPDAVYCTCASGDVIPMKWKPPSQMPRRSSRILLEITGVRVERLQDISEEDAINEGVKSFPDGHWKCYQSDYGKYSPTAIGSFSTLWNSINGEDSWYKNPWVWVIEFKQIQG